MTEPVCVHYDGTYDPLIPTELLTVQLFGAKRWYEDGWVYRLDGEVILDDNIYYYDDILVYMVQGVILGASEGVFMDTTRSHGYTWSDLEYVINNYEAYDEDADEVVSLTDEECMFALMNGEDNEDGDWDESE